MKKNCLLIAFLLIFCNVFSQEFLGANKSQIKKAMSNQCATLLSEEKNVKGLGITAGSYNLLFFTFPSTMLQKYDTYNIMFFSTTDDSCYRYIIKYASDRFLKTIINKYDNIYSGCKRVGNGLHWVDDKKGYEAEILNTSRNGTKISAITLAIYKKGM